MEIQVVKISRQDIETMLFYFSHFTLFILFHYLQLHKNSPFSRLVHHTIDVHVPVNETIEKLNVSSFPGFQFE